MNSFDDGEITLVAGLSQGDPALTDRDKLNLIQDRVEELLRNRIRLLRTEASAISSDMEALVLRLDRDGYRAGLGDIRSARWYRTAGDFKLLQGLVEFIISVTGRPGANIDYDNDDPDIDSDASDTDE